MLTKQIIERRLFKHMTGMKKAYIHIGLEKTGTTSLQVFLQKNRVALRSNNYDYMGDEDDLYVHGIGHFPIVASFYDKCPNIVPPNKHLRASEVLDALSIDSKASNYDIILSCEHFSSRLHKRENLQAIRESLSDRQIKIVCYLRPQDQHVVSAYSTLVKGGETKPFTIMEVNPQNRIFNYYEILEDWSSVFGRENIILREYNRDSMFGGDICLDFLNILNVPSQDFMLIEDQNISLGTHQIEILRGINKHLTAFPWSAWDVDIDKFEESQEIRRLLAPLLPRGEHIRVLLSHDQRRRVLDRFKRENLKICESYNGADFIHCWYDREVQRSDNHTRRTLCDVDFEIALVSCGAELLAYSEKIEELHERVEALAAERDEACSALMELKEQHKSFRFTLSKAASNMFKNIRYCLGMIRKNLRLDK